MIHITKLVTSQEQTPPVTVDITIHFQQDYEDMVTIFSDIVNDIYNMSISELSDLALTLGVARKAR